MPLAEAVIYLRRAVRRRLGPGFVVRFVDADSAEARRSLWGQETPLPLVVINGAVFSKGIFSFAEIIQALRTIQSGK